MSQKKADAAADLAGRMLQVLESQRSFGGDAYPPTLQHLGELCDGAPSPELIVKAATKKVFTDRASVQKVDKKPSLKSPVYFKEDRPKDDELLARRMLAVLEAQRRLGEDAYPPTLRRLAELCEFQGSDNVLRKAASLPSVAERTTVVGKKGKTLVLEAPIVFSEDLRGELTKVLPGLLRFALSPVFSKTKKGTSETAAFTPAELAKRVIPELKQRLEQTVTESVARQSPSRGVGWVAFKGGALLFLTENVQPTASRSSVPSDGHAVAAHRHPAPVPSSSSSDRPFRPRDFAQAFRAAFEILDRRNGSTNFVKLADLRDALSDFSREEFDAGLRTLRMDGVFSLDSHEGLHGSLSHEEREAGVREAGSVLVYASRR
jgi:hypothetical protein